MASEDGESIVTSPNLFRLDDDDDEFNVILGTQFPNDNPDLPLLDLDDYFAPEPAEQFVPQLQDTVQQPQLGVQSTPSTKEVGTTKTRRRYPRAYIPDNAEIIDLDALETGSSPRHNLVGQERQTHIKAEEQDDISRDVDPPAMVNTEEPERDLSWKAMPKQHVDLVDPHEEPTGNVHIDANLSGIKQEHEEKEWTWVDMQRKFVELSDSEDENLGEQAPRRTPFERPNQIEPSEQAPPLQPAPAPALSRSMLRSNIKTKRTTADRDRLLQIQKIYAEKALGRAVIAGAGGIFRGSQSSAANVPEDELAWMNSTVDPDEDVDAYKKFAEVKARYNRKKRADRNTFEDDVLFMKAESAEKARVKRLDDDYHRSRGPVYPEDVEELPPSEDDLFVRQSPLVTPSLKRPHAATVQSDDDNAVNATIVESDANDSDPAAYTTRKPQSKRKRQKELEKELQDSMMAGIEMELAKDQKKAARKAKAPRKTPVDGNSHNRKSRKGCKKSKAKSKMKKAKPTQEGYLNNLDSLFTSNVYEDANVNKHRPPETVTSSLVKDQALKSLLAGVPLDDLNKARGEKQHILRATKTLGSRKVKADGTGGWKFKGMTSSLYNHQVQGAAWMRERETGDVEPLGGLQADEMGLGKTVMTIACMISNPPAADSTSRCTLIVCPPSLITQWESELRKHTEQGIFPKVLKYHGRSFSRTFGRGAEGVIQQADVVFTSYQEVLKSYPKFAPPKQIVAPDKRREWWTETYEENRDILHRVHFHRIVLDEAQIIKNHMAQISIACRGLMGKHRWAISGTPIQNRVDEFYPFFKFLRVPHTGTMQVFKENFTDSDNSDTIDRLHSFLKQFMIRRTHRNTLFGFALVDLPKNVQRTISVEFNQVERAIYEAVKNRYIQKINRNSRDGVLEKSYSNVLTMLLRLRQLTAHPFMLQQTIEDLFELEDVENLWTLTAPEVSAEENPARNMLLTMKNMIADKGKPAEPTQTEVSNAVEDPIEETSESRSLVFKFRRFLRDLAGSQKWDDLKDRSLCHKCRDPPDDPWVTSCLHVYCKECLNALAYEATKRGEEETACLECSCIFTESRACDGLKELQMEAESSERASAEGSPTTRTRRDPEQELKWINFNGSILPSSKTAAVQAQIELWLQEEPDKKIIVFTQFHML